MYDEAYGDPVGVLVNGVLIFADHTRIVNGTQHTEPFVRSADSCNGHSDKGHRYHYHALPKCLLEELGVPSPINKTRYWNKWDLLSVEEQVDLWPENGEASPLIGYALDGFPIFGPYNASGHLQIGSSSLTRGNLNK